jgi:hypothetical protein
MLYPVNPVGFGSMIVSTGVSIAVFFGALRPGRPAVLAAGGDRAGPGAAADPGRRDQGPLLPTPYRRRHDLPMYDEHGSPSGELPHCHVCRQDLERPDVAKCQTHDAVVCSLCRAPTRWVTTCCRRPDRAA